MKIAVISDVHQSEFWRRVMEKQDDFDKIIFLGDEFDSWKNSWPFQMENALDIISFKKANPDKVELCWSNHAISYYLNERCSGYQSGYAKDIKEFYISHKNLYNVVYIYDKWLFSHAGISVKWMKCSGIEEISQINDLFREKPNLFRWIGPDGSGNNANEGPLWIRPEALTANYVSGFHQIAGHTEDEQPRIVKRFRQLFIFCDTYDHNYLTVLDTKTNLARFINLMEDTAAGI